MITEIQLGRDARKRLTWPLYIAALRAKLRCPVYLLVIAPDAAIAAWAGRDIVLGHPGFVLRPIVMGADELRVVNDVDAREHPQLSVLLALTQSDREIVSAALSIISMLPAQDQKLYRESLLKHASDVLGREQRKEHDVTDEDWKDFYSENPLIRSLTRYFYGREIEQRGERKILLAVARAKLSNVTPEDEALVEAQYTSQVLEDVTVALGKAATAEEARVAFEAIRQPSLSRLPR